MTLMQRNWEALYVALSNWNQPPLRCESNSGGAASQRAFQFLCSVILFSLVLGGCHVLCYYILSLSLSIHIILFLLRKEKFLAWKLKMKSLPGPKAVVYNSRHMFQCWEFVIAQMHVGLLALRHRSKRSNVHIILKRNLRGNSHCPWSLYFCI